MRKPIIAGNWKMTMSIAEAKSFVAAIKDKIDGKDVEAVLCAPFTMLKDLKEATAGTAIKVGAQNMHFEESGAFTGEISVSMLKELAVDYVIIGHSERREYFNETDDTVNRKVLKALEHNLLPILCCGETLEQRDAGKTKDVVKKQVQKGLNGVDQNGLTNVVIAYEPIWAIGTGKTATSGQANDVITYIREVVATMFGEDAATKIRIQYGGSVKPSNVAEIMKESDIDGALVGGASLQPDSFLSLVNFQS
ncbi:triose-phosphate isomerase [Desulforhopalus sp. IMCC35007]|uniref:triose-phosphate isomerase n=1 Tax=Desulforhopalus sp. IMCC35007 TaxID=2569543 RepID=UPI0010AEA989|nr:triose-phosphate isomerase [Desulforhopalus sp. IMCC35007]TKB09624.1 triose-phosphate isomerase [Desulforhopalus sp. IMCC35007]